jgi:hypothetical protein
MKSRLLPLLALLPVISAGAAADGSASPDLLVWRCWYDQQVHITCLIDSLPSAGTRTAAGLPSNLPAVVRQLRNHPEAFRNQFVHIPLHTQAEDMGSTGRLAQAAVCGSLPDCRVDFSPAPPSLLEIDELLHRDFSAAGQGSEDSPAAVPGGEE